MTSAERHINNEQPKTVEEHFDLIMNDDSFIESEHSKVTPKDLPNWFDEELFKKGQDYYRRNVLGINSAYLTGLIAVFLIPSIAKILTFTKKSSTPCAAFRRYVQTLLHINNIHLYDVMDPHSKFWKSLNTIRWKHSMSSRRSEDSKQPGILQRDMVLTQFGFVGYVLTDNEKIALTNEIEERQGINHFWRVIGHLLGIPGRLNLCRKNEYETTQLSRMIKEQVYLKYLEGPNTQFMHLTTVAVNGLACLDFMINVDAFLKFFYEIHDSTYKRPMSYYSQLNYLYRNTIYYLIGTPIVGVIVRNFWNWYLRFIYWMNERWAFIAWMKYGKEHSKLKLYPHATF